TLRRFFARSAGLKPGFIRVFFFLDFAKRWDPGLSAARMRRTPPGMVYSARKREPEMMVRHDGAGHDRCGAVWTRTSEDSGHSAGREGSGPGIGVAGRLDLSDITAPWKRVSHKSSTGVNPLNAS